MLAILPMLAALRVAARFPSLALRAAARLELGRGGKAGALIEPESGVAGCAASTTLSRSGLGVTPPIGLQSRVGPLQRDGLAARAAA